MHVHLHIIHKYKYPHMLSTHVKKEKQEIEQNKKNSKVRLSTSKKLTIQFINLIPYLLHTNNLA